MTGSNNSRESKLVVFELLEGERIIGVGVREGDRIDAVELVTSTRRRMRVGGIGSGAFDYQAQSFIHERCDLGYGPIAINIDEGVG